MKIGSIVRAMNPFTKDKEDLDKPLTARQFMHSVWAIALVIGVMRMLGVI